MGFLSQPMDAAGSMFLFTSFPVAPLLAQPGWQAFLRNFSPHYPVHRPSKRGEILPSRPSHSNGSNVSRNSGVFCCILPSSFAACSWLIPSTIASLPNTDQIMHVRVPLHRRRGMERWSGGHTMESFKGCCSAAHTKAGNTLRFVHKRTQRKQQTQNSSNKKPKETQGSLGEPCAALLGWWVQLNHLKNRKQGLWNWKRPGMLQRCWRILVRKMQFWIAIRWSDGNRKKKWMKGMK